MWLVILVGLVQGVAEFLPISSSGHLVMLYNIFNVTENTILLSIILHIATLFAVLFVYWKDVVLLIKNPFCKTSKLLVIATIPTIVIVLIFEKIIDNTFSNNFYIIGFLITAIILLVSEKLNNNRKDGSKDVTNLNIGYKQAIMIGVAQGIASVPGISRSGSTIATGLLVKVNKSDATKFSFLLSIPIIIASFCYELLKIKNATFSFSALELCVGFVVAFLFGIFAVKFMIKFVKQQKLYIFSIYLFLISLLLILNEYVFKFW